MRYIIKTQKLHPSSGRYWVVYDVIKNHIRFHSGDKDECIKCANRLNKKESSCQSGN